MKRIFQNLLPEITLVILAAIFYVVLFCVVGSRARGEEPVTVKVVKAWDRTEIDISKPASPT